MQTKKTSAPTNKNGDNAPSANSMTAKDLQKTKVLREKSWLKEKYLNSLKSVIRTRIKKLRSEHSDLSLKDFLVALLEDMPPEAPPPLLLIMTQFAIEKWEKSDKLEAVALA